MKLDVELKKIGRVWTEEANQAARRETAKALRDAAMYLMPELQNAAPVASGDMKDGIHTIISPSGLSVRLVQGEYYGAFISAGPSFISGQPNVEAIQRWVEVKLGQSGEEATASAFLISRAIYGKGGIEPNNWWYGTFDKLTPQINAQFLGPVGAALVEWLDN